MRRSISCSAVVRVLALLLSATVFFNSAGHTLAYIIAKTPSILNIFLSGLDPAGDLVIRKEAVHPFGDSYQIPQDLRFTFDVDLGKGYAGQTVPTSQGEMTADDQGRLTLTLAPGQAVRLPDLKDGTRVTVTERPTPGFTAQDGAEQSLTIRDEEQEICYVNHYAPAPVPSPNLEVTGTKVLEGRDWRQGDRFTFLLEYKSAQDGSWKELGTAEVAYETVETPDPEDPEKTILAPKPGFDQFRFTDLVTGLTYDRAGIYSFRVSEVAGNVPGVTYDKVVSYFDVQVADADMDSFLEIRSVTGYQNAAAFYEQDTDTHGVHVTVSNTYAPAGTASARVRISKSVRSLSGEEKSPAGFTFALYDQEGNLVATSRETSAAGETFLDLTYEAKDAGKTFHYVLQETNAGDNIRGMSYDETRYRLSVSIVDQLDGTIAAYIYSTEDYSAQPAEETQPTETTAETTEEVQEDVQPSEEAPADPTEDTTVPTEPETQPTEATTAPTEETTVPTEETTVPTEPATEPATEPTEAATVPTEPETQPTEAPTVPTEAEVAPVVETLPEEEPTQPATVATVAMTVPANRGISLSARSGGIRTMSGDQPEVPQLQPSEAPQETPAESEPVQETEPEETEQPLVVVIPEGASDVYEVSFLNTYNPTDTLAQFGGRKELSGRAQKAGEFRFDLYATGDSFTVTEDMTPIQSVTQDEDGAFTFSQLPYSQVGIYRYVVTEDPSDALGGITYDTAVYQVTVTVTDEDGALKAETAVTDTLGKEAELVFRNTYRPEKISAVFGGTKTLTGAKVKDYRFVFLLYAADENFKIQGGELDTAVNKADGTFAFTEIPYSEAGTYYYVIAEDDSEPKAGITYDATTYGVKVVVTDDGQGNLWKDVSYWLNGSEIETIEFRNSYSSVPDPTETSKPTDSTTKPTTKPSTGSAPSTGDNIRYYVVTMFASLAAILLLLPTTFRRKSGKYER